MKKLNILILMFTLLIFASFRVENDEVKIWTQQTTTNKAIDFEKSISKKIKYLEMNVSLSKSIYPLVDKYKIAKPIIIQRHQTGFLPLYTEYFYSEPDSIIRYISYDWEKEKYGNFFKKQEIWKEESKKLKEYNSEYEKIKSTLIVQLGEPTTQDTEPQKTESTSGRGYYLSRNTVWETDEYYSKLNMIFESMTYRIRWYYYWKK
ncbi:hypothetical protein EZ428_20870 [Pedobacter frigiditerrae]|uniref:Uncharacterized protein n=1 Tax=Pedobacter frigiditerrae TaxID=2530452 RepID=A0A4R0MNW8_9SPHI|nr:hypothetical protein [Pedobacter frigiditerrae]TCC88177.1 hypothetical protein EZ428_20870 [Pedobacter frigiditerrae]